MTRYEKVIEAIDVIKSGGMVILVDDEDRENEGDLCMAADKVTPEAINFMAREGRGLICLTLTEERINQLELPMMVKENRASLGTAFTVSIEAARGVTTGISAQDRAVTILAAIARDARPTDVVSPGHVFPLKARRGGVLVRTGQTEGSVDLARLAGCEPAGVICEIMRDDGEMARMPDLEEFGKKHGLMVVTIAELIEYRLQAERQVKRVASGKLRPALLGGTVEFDAHVYASDVDDNEYLALCLGTPDSWSRAAKPPFVRVQAMNPITDVFGPADGGPGGAHGANERQLRAALRAISSEGNGVFLYVYPRERVSLVRSFQKVVLGERPDAGGAEQAALRDFGLGAQVLADLGLHRIRLMSNNTKRIVGLAGFGIEVVEQVAFEPAAADASVVPLTNSKVRK